MSPDSQLHPGDTLGHHRIEALLGQGGMGQVFRATDLELGREVALKILPPAIADDPDRLRRFRREAKALASLSHPNIVSVFSVERAIPKAAAAARADAVRAEIDFITMELVDGKPLSEAIPAGGMTRERFFALAVPLADALAVAHESGIVHRDLKPANIIVDTKGRPRILDFGLAKTLAAGTDSSTQAPTASLATRTGAVLGSPGYMSPEQVKGESVGVRSDVFSLGLVLYEMATGRRAFEAPSTAEYLSSVLRDTPPLVESLRPELPRHLSRIVRRCLEKDPERRYPSAKDARNELEDLAREIEVSEILESQPPADREAPVRSFWPVPVIAILILFAAGVGAYLLVRRGFDGPSGRVPAGETPPEIQSLAVLPFDNLMNDPAQDYFVEGMHEALITDLSKIGALRVISRTSAMRYAESEKSLPEIAAELDVDALVEGSVLRADGMVRITAQLIEGESDRHLWAESYDRELEDVLMLLSEVARAIATEIEVTVTSEQEGRLAAAPRVDPEAQELFLRAQHYFNSGVFSAFPEALELHRQAVERDPTFARGWAGLAGSYLIHGFFRLAPPAEMIPQAVAAAERALELDDSQGLAHTVLGYVALFFDWDWERAGEELRLAIELAPTDVMAHHGYADYLAVMGDCAASVEQVLLGRRYDPMGGWANGFVVAHLGFCGEFEQAIEEGRRIRTLGIETLPIQFHMGLAHWQLGRYQEALEIWRQGYGPDSEISRAFETGFAEGGPAGAMLARADQLAAEPQSLRNPYSVASYYAAAEEADAAFTWLDRAYEERTPQLLHLVFDPRLDPIRADPRFEDLLRRIGIPERSEGV